MDDLLTNTRERLSRNAFMRYNHMELESVQPDRAVFRLDIRPESRNPFGMVHGGALYTLADNAAGVAVHTDGRAYVTQAGSLHFLRNQSEGTVRAASATGDSPPAWQRWTSPAGTGRCWPRGSSPSSVWTRTWWRSRSGRPGSRGMTGTHKGGGKLCGKF